MKVSEVMTRQPQTIDASETVQHAARLLKERAIGMLPVARDDKLLGVLTDRDIVVRVVAEQRDPARTPVSTILSSGPRYCYEDEDTDHVARNMDELLVRRLPVMDRNKRLVGVVSIEDIRPRKRS